MSLPNRVGAVVFTCECRVEERDPPGIEVTGLRRGAACWELNSGPLEKTICTLEQLS